MRHAVMAAALSGCVAFNAAALEIVRLRCESAADPVGTANARPRLSWSLAGGEPAMRPARAEVRVAQAGTELAKAPVQFSDDLFSCVYSGKLLEPGVAYRWQVRLANADGSGATQWSDAARFVVALQSPEQWNGAQWIGEEQYSVHWTNISYEVKFEHVTNAFGAFFRATSPTNGYMWQINFAMGTPKLRPHVYSNGQPSPRLLPAVDLARFFPGGLDPARPHTLRIELRDKLICTSIDGVKVDERTDGTHVSGTIGVRTGRDEYALVDRLCVRAPDGNTLLYDAFAGHVLPAFRKPKLKGAKLELSNAVFMHHGILPKNCPRLRKTFALGSSPVVSAIVSICGLGFYELWINGQKADPYRVMAPAMTDLSRAALFDTYDVTHLLKAGKPNTVGIWLAPGYSDDFSRYCWHWLDSKCAILHLSVRHADGTVQTVATDGTWEMTQKSPVTRASIYHGETYDASLADPSWCTPSGDGTGWRPAVVTGSRAPSKLLANDAPPVRMSNPLHPVNIAETRPGVFTADFGQNRAGFVKIRVRGPKGTKISLHTSELIGDDGQIDPWTNRNAASRDEFILAGTGDVETYMPRFTYHGFRYVEISGWPGRPSAEDLEAWAVHADVERIGTFKCSNATLNRFLNAAIWSMLSNFASFPTDCCMRDERTCCQMDSQAYEDAAIQFFDMTRYYNKWMDDIRDGQGNPDWNGDKVTLPNREWMATGDRRIFANRYDSIKTYVDSLARRQPDLIFSNGFGDWCAPNDGTWAGYFNDVDIVNTSIFCAMAGIAKEAASILGKDADAADFAALHEKAKTAFHERFYNPETHAYGDGSQATSALPLAFGIVPEECRAAVEAELVRAIRKEHGCKLNTGIYGTRYLGDVLCDMGEADLYVHLYTQPEYPGFGFMQAKGATTLWEQWTFKGGMNSHNHAMFSGAANTLMTRLGGIRPASPGYASLEIRPAFPRAIDYVEASRETPRGRVAVAWRRLGGNVTLDVTVPPLTPAVLRLPGRPDRQLAAGHQRIACGNIR